MGRWWVRDRITWVVSVELMSEEILTVGAGPSCPARTSTRTLAFASAVSAAALAYAGSSAGLMTEACWPTFTVGGAVTVTVGGAVKFTLGGAVWRGFKSLRRSLAFASAVSAAAFAYAGNSVGLGPGFIAAGFVPELSRTIFIVGGKSSRRALAFNSAVSAAAIVYAGSFARLLLSTFSLIFSLGDVKSCGAKSSRRSLVLSLAVSAADFVAAAAAAAAAAVSAAELNTRDRAVGLKSPRRFPLVGGDIMVFSGYE